MDKPILSAPFFVFENNSLDIFQTIDEIEQKIEPIDVLNHEYDIYDSEGNVLKFHVIQTKTRFLGLFKITTDTVQFSHGLTYSKDELFQRMQQTYIAWGGSETDDLTFDELKNKLFDLLSIQ
ncbi:hypothetical protein [Wielerella bovis]|uniref:hypothetical protein n=1 Tax=Wielerella bovis TaxID=2917790 RepID=UPI0020196835|nr:hypothetical protein [Wielerella bovis]ULJ64754.1 hypothetical protein MIS33_00020 [Wielerella bovis]ULJ67026.1 hypothetical protein MIS31_00020 [Wielerella bovis]